ncbi:MAG: ATP F0F1 synthase subunit B [Beijerinckiaceae bacterium]
MDKVYVGIGFLIFVSILGYFGVHKMILSALDARGAKVAEQLAAASQLRAEAEKLLVEYEAKRKAAEKEAAAIVDEAKAEAERIRVDQEAKLNDFVARRTKMAEQKIAAAEASATSEVRAAAADAAVRAAEIVLVGQTKGKLGDDLIAAGLKDVKARMN